jgi:hypothetical protein
MGLNDCHYQIQFQQLGRCREIYAERARFHFIALEKTSSAHSVISTQFDTWVKRLVEPEPTR